MGIFQQKTPMEKEWEALNKREKKFLTSRQEKEDTALNQFLSEKVPPTLQDTLDAAFFKAFQLIFEKGTGVIEKTYRREDLEKNFQVKEFSHEISGSRKTLKAFSKGARNAGNKGMALSGASGIGMGLLGVGIPDIPVFTAMILRTVYEIALSYGFHYDTEEEQYLILLLIQGAVSHGAAMDQVNGEVNRFLRENTLPLQYDKDDQIRKTAGALSKELLYMKFLQGIPVVGAIGGVYDLVYMKQITEYATIKYQRRFLRDKR